MNGIIYTRTNTINITQRWAILPLLLICWNGALAQSKADSTAIDTLQPIQVEQVRVEGKTQVRKIKEQAFSVNVIDAKQIYNSSIDLNQALNRSTGVRVREDGGMGSNFSFSLNGFTGKQVKFFLDGLPMDNFGSSLTLNNLPATMAERVEIYKGVLPVSLGADALGGAVNIVTRTNSNYLDVSYGYGSFNTHKVGINGTYTHKRTGITIRTNSFYNYSDNNYNVNVRPLDWETLQYGPEQEIERFHDGYSSIGAQVDFGVSGKSYADHLLFGAILSGNSKDIQTGVTMEQVFGARRSESKSVIPTVKYKKSDLFLKGMDLNFYGAYNMTNNHFIDTARYRYNWLQQTVPTSSAEVSRSQLRNRDKEALVSANLSYSLNDFQSFSLNYVLTDFQRKSSDVENPGNISFLMPQGLRKNNVGLAWQATYSSFTSTLFSKLYGLHAESFEDVSTNTVPSYERTALNRAHVGYGMAAAYFITPSIQAKASYEHTYRLPEATELLGDGLFVRRNSNLKPEKSDNINFGGLITVISDGDSRLNIEGGFVFRNAKDYIRQDQKQAQPVDRQYINVGDVRTTGAEAEIRYSWKNKLFASANATFQDIIDRTEFLVSENLTGTTRSPNLNFGYRLPNMPYLFGNVHIGTRFITSDEEESIMSINYSLAYVEKYYFTPNQIGSNNQDIIPRQVSHDIFADYSFKKGKYVIALECRNLMNSRLYDNYLLQKPGRSFFLKLRYFLSK